MVVTEAGHRERGRDRILASARQLYATSGFHQSPMSELAEVAQVSVGQVYRLFEGKHAIIQAIVSEDAEARIARMDKVVVQAEAGELTIADALEALFVDAMEQEKGALSFEILAEAHRNGEVATTIAVMCDDYRALLGRLVRVANPAIGPEALDAAEEMLLACLFGLGHRGLSRPHLPARGTAARTSRMILTALQSMPD